MPSLIWVAVGHMDPEQTVIDLAPVYRKQGIRFTVDETLEINVAKPRQTEDYPRITIPNSE